MGTGDQVPEFFFVQIGEVGIELIEISICIGELGIHVTCSDVQILVLVVTGVSQF